MKNKENIIDPTTWTSSDSKAATILADILTKENNVKITRFVSKNLARLNVALSESKTLNKNKMFFIKKYQEEMKKVADVFFKDEQLSTRNKTIKTHFLCVVSTLCKSELQKQTHIKEPRKLKNKKQSKDTHYKESDLLNLEDGCLPDGFFDVRMSKPESNSYVKVFLNTKRISTVRYEFFLGNHMWENDLPFDDEEKILGWQY